MAIGIPISGVSCSQCGGLGSGPLGSSPFGSGGTGISFANVLSNRQVLVCFIDPVKAVNFSALDDALNPALWTLQLLRPFGAPVPLAQSVSIPDGETDRKTVIVSLDARLQTGARYEILAASTMRMASGAVLTCDCAPILGARDAPSTVLRATDIASPQYLQDTMVQASSPLATRQITDRGGVGVESGKTYLRKRVARRLSTPRGGFYHLPTYGLRPDIKSLFNDDQLEELERDARVQILEEPDVSSVSVSAGKDSTSVAFLEIEVRDRSGDRDAITISDPENRT